MSRLLCDRVKKWNERERERERKRERERESEGERERERERVYIEGASSRCLNAPPTMHRRR